MLPTTENNYKYYQEIVNFANVAILRFDKDFKITDFTGNSSKIFGFTPEEVIGKSLYETIVPRTESSGRDLNVLISDIVKSTKSYEYNINENITKDGKRIWMQWYNSEIKDSGNETSSIISIGIDISDRIRAEIALKESNERFKTLSNLTFEGILIHENGIILDCNYSLETLIGYSREELIGMDIFEKLIPEKHHEKLKQKLHFEAVQYEMETIHKDGTLFPISIESRNTIFNNKSVVVVAIKNIMEIKKTLNELDQYKNKLEDLVKKRTLELHNQSILLQDRNEELQRLIEELKDTQSYLVHSEKMASLGVLTAGIAHELNNPINFVFAGVNSMKKDFNDMNPVLEKINEIHTAPSDKNNQIEELDGLIKQYEFNEAYASIKQTIEHIYLGANRAAEIIKGLSNFSRYEKGEWENINIHESLENVLILLKNKYKYKAEIIRDFELDMPQIECFSGKINQVLMNLVSNAVDSITENGEIIIKTRTIKNKTWLQVSVKDNGSGISDDIKSKIFDPFFTTKEIGKGIGLGLSISYNIIKEHKGEIYFESEPNQGTSFIIEIPIKQN